MKKRVNLLLLGILLGGVAAAALPTLGRIMIFTAVGLVIYMTYDEFSYSQDHKQHVGGIEHENN